MGRRRDTLDVLIDDEYGVDGEGYEEGSLFEMEEDFGGSVAGEDGTGAGVAGQSIRESIHDENDGGAGTLYPHPNSSL